MFKNSLDLRLHIEDLVYKYIRENAHEVASYQLGLSGYAGDPIYVTQNEVIVSEDLDDCFRKYSGFDISCNKILIDGYFFYSKSKTDNCKVSKAIDFYWQKQAIKNFKNKEDK